MSRADLRHERDRIRAQRKGYWSGNASASPRNLGLAARTPHPCSGWCCGNPRRHFKREAALTMQERRALLVNAE